MAATSKKPWRNFRRKVADESDSEDNKNDPQDDEMEIEEEKNTTEVMEKPVKKKKKKKDKKESAKLLSFEDDHDLDDGDVFKIKKSSYSKKIARQMKKEKMKEKEEILKAKEENSSPKDQPQKRSEEETDEKIRRLREEFMTLNGDDAAALDADSDEEDKGTLHKLLGKGEIPDANLIHNIRKKRQQARDMGDFVPLDNAAKPENSSSRLVREDDNDKSEDDEEGRMDFTINVAALERQRIKDQFLAAEHGSDEESEQEREWEAQQIRKGVTVGQPVENKPEDQISDDNTGQTNGYTGTPSSTVSATTFKPFTAMSKTENLADINMDVIKKRLQERLDSMDEVNRRHTQERDTLVNETDDADKNIVTCEGSVDTLEKRYCFFQEMRGYVRDLVDCLNEKVPIINDLETRMLNQLRRRSEQLVARRQQDVRDQCQDYMTSKAKIVVDAEGQAKQMRTAEREARRSRRRRKREMKNIRGHHEGLSSDDEENQSEITKFNLEKDAIDTGMERLFEDVQEEFREVSCVRERFESWKQDYGETYSDAYIGLCLPKLFNPFVRLQLIQWNPLEANCQDFEDTQWFETLVFYGCQPEASEQELNNDDIKILPTITEKIIIPRLTVLSETVWDPLSTTQTSRLVNTLQRIIRDYPCAHSSNRSMQNLLHAVVKRLQKTMDDDVFMPLYPKSAIENRSSGASVFFHRQSWTCIKLLGSIMSWHGIISTSILQNLALDGLLNRYIILGLCNSVLNQETIQKCHSIVSTFPKEWFSGLNEEKTLPQLENLCKYMVSAARNIDKDLSAAKDMDKKEYRDMIKQINKMLVNVHALDHALSLQI